MRSATCQGRRVWPCEISDLNVSSHWAVLRICPIPSAPQTALILAFFYRNKHCVSSKPLFLSIKLLTPLSEAPDPILER